VVKSLPVEEEIILRLHLTNQAVPSTVLAVLLKAADSQDLPAVVKTDATDKVLKWGVQLVRVTILESFTHVPSLKKRILGEWMRSLVTMDGPHFK